MSGSETLPRWNLDPVYPGLESARFAQAKEKAASLSRTATELFSRPDDSDLAGWLIRVLDLDNEMGALFETLSNYAYASFSTSTRDTQAMACVNAVEELNLEAKKAIVLLYNSLASRRKAIESLVTTHSRLSDYLFYLRESFILQEKQMSPELEDLAEDLSRSGADAWSRLQEAVSSNCSVLWDAATGERKTVVELRNLAFDEKRDVREKAYRLELDAWKSVEIPLAAALNGVKGTVISLDSRRGWAGSLDKSIEQSRISSATLDALTTALERSLPLWRRYLAAKARVLGVERCAFYDLFAPVGKPGAPVMRYSFSEARDFIVEKFAAFDPEMGAFAEKAFRENWIDAEPREGKVGGAYCIDFPDAGAARILCNFDGSFSSISTIAHELGHAWHHECIKGKPYVLTRYPMTLAETASIFAETVIFENAVAAADREQKFFLLETHLQDGCQIIVDIMSRFHFEQSVFKNRRSAELSPEKLCALMLDAQKKTYGDGLDPELLHPYMWAAKGHYYIPSLSFYNYPYAFGQLFGLALFRRYQEEGPAFAPVYRNLLAETGSGSAVDLSRKAGFDIESVDFWMKGIEVFAGQFEEFESLIG